MTKRIYILFISLLFTQVVFGQFIGKDAVSKALFYLQKNELDSSKKYIDEADLDQELITLPKTWYYKSLIYKDLYKLNEKDNKNSPLRLTAVESLKKLTEIDTTKEFIESAQKMMTYLASTFYNDAARSLNPQAYKNAEEYYAKYRELILLSNTGTDLLQQDIKFKLALASMLNQDLEKQAKKDSTKIEEVKGVYKMVLSLDTNNGSANYNIGIIYYNEAVDLINNMDYDMDLEKLNEMQDVCINLFLQSLPYMLKSYDLKYNEEATIKGLENIYHGLNDTEKEEFFKNLEPKN
ncbi:MAG: hypothetical protein HYU68_12720 [Bacteroidetes bacterium]|nr:hypothetical protein [Bacteroidota bacterium]